MVARDALRVWDMPTRAFHWLLAVAIGFSWWSAETGAMDWHRRSGLVVLGLVAFRLGWGFFGGSTARFARFARGPRAVIAYVRGGGGGAPGHNPLGGWSVLLMLGLVVAQVGAGLFSVDVDGIESGPLSDRVSFDAGRQAAHIHHLVFDVLLAAIALHVGAIAVYALRGRNLVRPMLTGANPQLDPAAAPLAPARRPAFFLLAGAAAALAWWIGRGAPW